MVCHQRAAALQAAPCCGVQQSGGLRCAHSRAPGAQQQLTPYGAQKLLSGRYHGDEGRKDIHERDLAFLKSCRETALYAAEHLGWKVIPCSRDGEPRSLAEIEADVAAAVKEAQNAGILQTGNP